MVTRPGAARPAWKGLLAYRGGSRIENESFRSDNEKESFRSGNEIESFRSGNEIEPCGQLLYGFIMRFRTARARFYYHTDEHALHKGACLYTRAD